MVARFLLDETFQSSFFAGAENIKNPVELFHRTERDDQIRANETFVFVLPKSAVDPMERQQQTEFPNNFRVLVGEHETPISRVDVSVGAKESSHQPRNELVVRGPYGSREFGLGTGGHADARQELPNLLVAAEVYNIFMFSLRSLAVEIAAKKISNVGIQLVHTDRQVGPTVVGTDAVASISEYQTGGNPVFVRKVAIRHAEVFVAAERDAVPRLKVGGVGLQVSPVCLNRPAMLFRAANRLTATEVDFENFGIVRRQETLCRCPHPVETS